MSYSDSAKAFLRNKTIFIKGDNEAYTFDSFSAGWKKIAAFNQLVTNVRRDERGVLVYDYSDTFDYENDALAASILLTAVDSDDQPITWNIRNEGIDMADRLESNLEPGIATLSGGNRLNITPQNVLTRDANGKVTKQAIGNLQKINVFTSDSPNFTSFPPLSYQTVDGDDDGNGYNWQNNNNRIGRFEFSLEYSHDLISITKYNTPKILDLVSFGTAKTFFSSRPQGTTSNINNNQGVIYKNITGLEEPQGRLYHLKSGSLSQFSNPEPGTNFTSMNTSTNQNALGTFNFKDDVVATAKGIAIDSTGSKAYVLSTSSTTHPPKTIVEYDIDTPYDMRTARFRSSQYNDIKIGAKSQLRDNGKYLYSLRYSPYNYNGGNHTFINTPLSTYGDANTSLTQGYMINYGGFDWPLKAYIYRYTLEDDYTSSETGTIFKTGAECDKIYNAGFYDHHKRYRTNSYPSYNQRTFSGAYNVGYYLYWYYAHRGPVVGFDMTDGNHLYMVTTKSYDRGHVVHINLNTQWDQTSHPNTNSSTVDETIEHTIGSQSGSSFFLANWKTNGVWDIKVNNDGTSIYILDTESFAIYQYDMSTPHTLSSLNRTELTISAKTVDTNGYDKRLVLSDIPSIASSPPRTFDSEVSDGINITGLNSALRQNATQPNSFRDFSMVRSFNFNNDGSRLYVNNDHRIYRYNLSTPFDLSTALFGGSTETYRSYMEDKHQHVGVGHYIDSTNQKFYISSERYDLNKENQGVIHEFNLADSVGSGQPPYVSKIHSLDSDNWGDLHLNSDGSKMYVSGPNKIKILNLSIDGVISSSGTDSNYIWDSAVKFSGDMITTNPNESDVYVADSSNTIRMVTLGNADSIISVDKKYLTVAPSGENTIIRGMSWFSPKDFIIGGNNTIDHFKTKDSFQVADI